MRLFIGMILFSMIGFCAHGADAPAKASPAPDAAPVQVTAAQRELMAQYHLTLPPKIYGVNEGPPLPPPTCSSGHCPAQRFYPTN